MASPAPVVRAKRPTPPTDDAPAPVVRNVKRRSALPYLLVLGAVVMVALALGYPLVRQFVLAFQEYGLAQSFGMPAEFVGLQNFQEVLSDPYTYEVFARSLIFCFVTAAVTMIIGVFFAFVMIRMSGWARTLIQTILLLVWSIPIVSSLTVWQLLFDTRFGAVNWVLERAVPWWQDDYNWLGQATGMLVIASIIVTWMSVPLVSFMAYSGLAQVPDEINEAAELDGANGWERFRFVTVPVIAPVLYLIGLLQIIWDLRVFTQIKILQDSGASLEDTDVLGTYIFRLGIGQGDFGMASATATIVLFLTVFVTLPYVYQLFKNDKEETA
ncbi:carbohydrate ABC transporter membrane protein 1 (CUT1 family) [Sediminihabitans luteus]|uniref:Carbohydrate ABC transporter membrane protein 1 (CUT1 family) n=1 Tax=Sediminihabitans luteus TaxID=1138585 RepID=A0A2M9CZ36_9CELL|nr:sugar ABC transporter permease [Sediminihabitans luteus]PJJ77157.1 carbohydrate ABC transporter membrane protein 1 (CUT1 family) [Sediminihabitans luteus]GII98605.1 sugar ABC transporter permease [Sediminihabitans luteus]